MPRVFISYRKSDSADIVGRLADALRSRLAAGELFWDERSLEGGAKWPDRLRKGVEAAEVVLAVIGKTWLSALDESHLRRIDQQGDWVRTEIALALKAGKVVIPVLVGGAKMPDKTAKLRKDIAALIDCQAAPLRSGKDFDHDVEELAKLIGPARRRYDSEPYLKWLRGFTQQIDFRGLKAGKKEIQAYPMDDLYIPLMTYRDQREAVPLEQALSKHRHLVIQGDAGSGKTTFLRYEAWQICREESTRKEFPIFVSIARLDTFIQANPKAAAQPDSPGWIALHLEDESRDKKWGLDRAFFEQKLGEADTVILLDGLDEAGSESRRESMARLFEESRQAFPKCRWVVTTRPGAYSGKSTLAGFAVTAILDLEPAQIEGFLKRWSLCLRGDEQGAAEHHRDLQRALDGSPWEIRRMARNPLMLSALAVVHYNEKRLPDRRDELYECILQWLAKSRKGVTAEERLKYYGYLALSMQDTKGAYRTRIGKGDAAECLAREFNLEDADAFLAQDEVDSGIVTSEGGRDIKFYHRSFEEYLAARYIAKLRAKRRWPEVEPRLWRAEWRETFVLLAGCIFQQSADQLQEFFEELIDYGLKQETLENRARVVGLTGSMLADLRVEKFELEDAAADYRKLRDDVMRIFEPGGAPDLDVKSRARVADALAQAGDPRLRLPVDDEYWVKLDSLTIGRYPVTVHEYAKYVGAGGKEPDKWEEQLRTPSRPVVYVDWHMAVDYCRWVKGVRLPSEAEWELAAAGREKREYPWGNTPEPNEELANYDMKVGAPTAVGLFPKGNTPEGIADMAGNVWEWTSSDHERRGKAVRGGACLNVASRLRAAYRLRDEPHLRDDDLGFRLVRE